MIATRPEIADETMRECADLGIRHVWMHRAFGAGSVSEAAADYGRAAGHRRYRRRLSVHVHPAADLGHKVMRAVFTLTGKVPREV